MQIYITILRICYVTASPYILRKSGHECKSSDLMLGIFSSVEECAEACTNKMGCVYFIFGNMALFGVNYCFWEQTSHVSCPEGWKPDDLLKGYDFYEIVTSGI